MKATLWYVNIFVTDFDRAVDFYQNTLELPLAFRDDEFGYASFHPPGAGLSLARVDAGSADAASLVGRHTGVGLGVPDLHAAHAELESRGVEFTLPPTVQPWGGLLATFVDPDGNVLYLDQLREHP
jgi:predicted enzyme related to lactoylglutathione lyase